MFKYERELFNQGIKKIAGVDEVGRGPLAGPIVAAAVIIDLEYIFDTLGFGDTARNNDVANEKRTIYNQIKDSKLLSHRKRLSLNEYLLNEAISYSIVSFSNSEIDSMGIARANNDLFFKAIQNLRIVPEHILTDHFKIPNLEQDKQTNIKKGDTLSISIAAASIIAKVYRDNIMIKAHSEFPKYKLDKNKGYGTKEHLEAIYKYGPCELHRKSFEPIKSLIKNHL